MSNLTFEEWMKEIDRIVGQRFFISVYDLPDRMYRDMYDDGYLPDAGSIVTGKQIGRAHV